MSNIIPSVGFYEPENSEAFDKSIFSENMDQDDSEVLTWALNVTQKAYERGMVSAYIERNKTENVIDDKDYIDFWGSITIIFGYIVRLSRQVGLDSPTQETFFKYLEQKNLFNSPTEEIIDLEFIARNYYDEIRKRGTRQIYRKRGEDDVDGENRRIVSYSEELKDEFNFILHEPYKVGWVVNNSSPLYVGLEGHEMSNKLYETISIEDLAKWPTVGTPTIEDESGTNVISLDSGDAIGGNNLAFEIPYHAGLCYQISFLVKGSGTLSFGARVFDKDGEELSLLSVVDGTDSSVFFTGKTFPNSSEYYLVVGLIYPYNFVNFNSDLQTTNLGIGVNLQSIREARTLIPQINSTSGNLKIKDIKFGIQYLEWNFAFIHPTNFVSIASNNRNGKLSPFEIAEAIRYYMLPYDSALALKLLENLDEPEEIIDIDLLEVLLNKTNQGIISGTNLLLYTT